MITRINPPELGTPPGYSQIVEVTAGRIIFIAGQTALDRDGNVVGRKDFAAQAEQVFRNLTIALEASQCTPANLVKTPNDILLSSMLLFFIPYQFFLTTRLITGSTVGIKLTKNFFDYYSTIYRQVDLAFIY